MTSATSQKPPAPTLAPPAPGGVKVRMYRQGLGDCFLLTFCDQNAKPFYMLIDCGVIKGTDDPKTKMEAVAADIYAATGGHLHILVATHEHWDHLSGFLQAQDIFQQFTVDTVWLAWTEDKTDDLANTLRNKRAARINALHAAVARMQGMDSQQNGNGLNSARCQATEQIKYLLDFFGDAPQTTAEAIQNAATAARSDTSESDGQSAGGATTRAALDFIQKAGVEKARKVRYCRPGEDVIDLLDDKSVRIYVLGPPHDAKLIKQSDPTKSGHEVYELSPHLTLETAFLVAAQHGLTDEEKLGQKDKDALEQLNRSYPFDKCYHLKPDEAKAQEFFQEHYGFDKMPSTLNNMPSKSDETPSNADDTPLDPDDWRRIDGDWLDAAGQLALQLDSDTNNTSLAIAIELGEKGKVLLFPGDAQVGNWLSWKQYSWPKNPAANETPITSKDLLARTVLYKVGHHGSHNATLRAEGLELMTSPELVAMIPVDEAMAHNKKHWNMPFPDLYAALKAKTRDRIIRVDYDRPDQPDPPEKQWQESPNNPIWEKLYVEFMIAP